MARYIAGHVVEHVDRLGVDAGIEEWSSLIPMYTPGPDHKLAVQVMIAVFSPKHGPRQLCFWNDPAYADGAMKLHDLEGMQVAGTFQPRSNIEMGARGWRPYDTPAGYLREVGPAMLQAHRVRAWGTNDWRKPHAARFCVGGQVDLTIVDKDGAHVETIHRWPDVVGKPINPFAVPGMSRQQRRAAARRAA